jgi:hypothetical protein
MGERATRNEGKLADTRPTHSLHLLSKIGEHLLPLLGSLRGAAAAVGSFGLLLVRPFNCYPLEGMRDLLTFLLPSERLAYDLRLGKKRLFSSSFHICLCRYDGFRSSACFPAKVWFFSTSRLILGRNVLALDV